jgi:hypothetical protein
MPHFPTHSKFFHNLWGSYWHGGTSLRYQLSGFATLRSARAPARRFEL